MKAKNLFLIIIVLTTPIFAFSQNIKGNKMTKIIQVAVLGSNGSTEAEQLTNKFLIEKKITPENLIDIKISRSNYVSVMIIYKVNYEE